MICLEDTPTHILDALRYQWLRKKDLGTISEGGVFAGITPENLVLNEEDLDSAIDREMIEAGKAT